jgi:hypothetical protein
MMLRRLFTVGALAVIASLSLSGVAHAGYDFSTSVPSANVTGGSGIVVSASTSFTDPNLNSGNPVSTPFGYTRFLDGGGSTVYLINSYTQNFPVSPAPSTPTTNILISTPSGTTDSSSWSFTSVITITNPSVVGATGSFNERVGYGMQVTGGAGSAVSNLGPLFVGATGITVSGNQFFISNPQATSVQVNFTGGNAALSAQITAIPEPASVVMLGAGLVGVVTLVLRRRWQTA